MLALRLYEVCLSAFNCGCDGKIEAQNVAPLTRNLSLFRCYIDELAF